MPAHPAATSPGSQAGPSDQTRTAAAVARWADAHAATIPADPDRSPGPPAPRPTPEPAETVLVSCTEIGAFEVPGEVPDTTGQGSILTLDWGHLPDGRLVLATGGRDLPVQIWDPDTGTALLSLAGNVRYSDSVAWGHDRDGKPLLAAGCRDGAARIWDPGTGELTQTLVHSRAGSNRFVRSVAWAHRDDGEPILATGGYDGMVGIWDPDTGQNLRTWSAHTNDMEALAWGRRPDGRVLLATGGEDGDAGSSDGSGIQAVSGPGCAVRIWDPDTGELVHSLIGHAAHIYSAAWGRPPDGRILLASASSDGSVRVWDGDGDEPRGEIVTSQATGMLSASWAPLADGRAILAANSFDRLSLWDYTTLQLIHTEARAFNDAGCDHLRWAADPAGRLLLAAPAADQRVHIWEVILDPPAGARDDETPRDRVTLTTGKPSKVLDPPEEVTPDFPEAREPYDGAIAGVVCAVRADGHILAGVRSSRSSGSRFEILDVSTGRLLRTILESDYLRCASLRTDDLGRLLLATGSHDHLARIWDPDTGELLQTLSGHTGTVTAVAWGRRLDGGSLLATASHDGTAGIWDADSGELLRTLAGHGTAGQSSVSGVAAAAWGYQPDGTPLLATGGYDGLARIWDPGTGELLHTLTGHRGTVYAVAWEQRPGRTPLLATGGNRSIRIWDLDTGQPTRTLGDGQDNNPFELAWARLSDQRTLLVSAGNDGSARIWDAGTGTELGSVPSPSLDHQSFALVGDAAGDLLLVVAARASESVPVRVWRIATGLASGSDGATRHRLRSTTLGLGSSRLLLRLGRGGWWPPLGLLADLIELTGPQPAGQADRAAMADAGSPAATPLCDPRLASLAVEPGIGRLRALGWAPDARAALAALLASPLAIPERYHAPSGVSAETLRDALIDALTGPGTTTPHDGTPQPGHASAAGQRASAGSWHAPVGELRAAATAVSDRAITLLRILGPAACAADPLLPVRLAHRIPELPALSRNQLRLLADAGTRPAASGGIATGTLVYSPGTAGLTRTGPLSRLLPTQLALPRDMLSVRLAENQLLYRQHRAPARPGPEPVTIILDTTPPTFGPAGHALRLAAHLIATTLWDHDRRPHLITLTQPGQVSELRTPADLVDVWADATLDDPGPALATALRTATEIGQPTVFCTHHRTPRDGGYVAGPATRLLTSHQPPEQAPRPPTGRWHAHLPPDPDTGQLASAVGLLLTPRPAARVT